MKNEKDKSQITNSKFGMSKDHADLLMYYLAHDRARWSEIEDEQDKLKDEKKNVEERIEELESLLQEAGYDPFD